MTGARDLYLKSERPRPRALTRAALLSAEIECLHAMQRVNPAGTRAERALWMANYKASEAYRQMREQTP